ncbi:MAG: preprotein translocase subunit SecE [Clostridia bacterium]|nr:preprotein translocase subunit SecE [Clostridia bacterium]MBR6110006.1 preprotein translocase subunit SecE [Clostridia bacterium]
MAKKEVEKKNKVGFFTKVGNFFKGIGKYFKDVWAEVKQLTWPTKKELINYTLAVIAFCALMAIIIGLLDLAFGSGINALAELGK